MRGKRIARIRHVASCYGVLMAALLLGSAGVAHAQAGLGPQGLGGNVGGPGIVPLGGLEAEMLETISVGIPIAPGVSIDQKYSFDRTKPDATLNKSGIALSFPWADVTIGMSGEISVTAVGPGVADIPNYLMPALLPSPIKNLIPFKFGGGTTLGHSSISPGQNGGLRN